MNVLQPEDINEISGGNQAASPISSAIGLMLFHIPYKYGQNLCDYYTGWDPITGWNGPAIPGNQAAD